MTRTDGFREDWALDHREIQMPHRLLRLLALLAVLTLVAAACGGDDDGDVATDGDGTTQVDGDGPEKEPGTGAEDADDGTTGDVEGDGAGAGAAVESGDTAGESGGEGTGGTAGGGGDDGGGTTDDTESPAGLQPTAPGEYHITVDGTSKVGGQSQEMSDRTLEVRPPDGRRQVQVTTTDDGSSRTEYEMEFSDDGVRLHRVSLSQQGVAKTFRFSPPVLAVPGAAQVGQKWSWSGTSDDGATTLDASFEVLQTGVPVTVGGQQISTVELRSIITTSGDLESTSTDVQWVSPEHRLIVKSEGSSDGQYGPFSFESRYTWKLDSINPS